VEDSLDEILSLVSQTKRDLYRKIGLEKKAEEEHIRAAKYDLDAAIASARDGKFSEALRLFGQLQSKLQESNLLESEWAEIYVAQAICHARLGQKREMALIWQKAYQLEPDNNELKRIAKRLSLLPASVE